MKNRMHPCAELLSAKPLPVRQTQAFELGLRIAKKRGKSWQNRAHYFASLLKL